MNCAHCGKQLKLVVIYNHAIMRCPNIAVQHPPVIYVPTTATKPQE